MTVWKFPLKWGQASVVMPEGAKVVHVGKDPASGYPAVWALVDPESSLETRDLAVIGTGHFVPSGAAHQGSFIDDAFVWHIFETTPRAASG